VSSIWAGDYWIVSNLIQDVSRPAVLEQAVARLHGGGLVAIPTETVYGLAADVQSQTGVARVFAAKGRPADHPLILHVAADSVLAQWAQDYPDYVPKLVAAFWPGPLTLVLPRTNAVPDTVTGGQDTVAVRSPAHPVAQELLDRLSSGLVAPSANRFGGVSPTSAAAVLSELGAYLDPQRDLILDGGNCHLGLESTILDCTGACPQVLRPGAIGLGDIAVILPDLLTGQAGQPGSLGEGPVPRVSGALDSHYSPRATVRLAAATQLEGWESTQSRQIGLIADHATRTPAGWRRLLAPASLTEFARGLYGALRAADELALAEVVAVLPAADPAEPLSLAIVDRLTRAAAG